jgi:protein TonB
MDHILHWVTVNGVDAAKSPCHIKVMDELDLEPPVRTKIGVIVFVALLHIVAVMALIRAFAPDFAAQVTDQVIATFTVTVTAPQPTPTPEARETAGAAAEVGKKAKPKPVIAPQPKIAIAKQIAPKAASNGNENSSGARDAGAGTGAGGQGNGTGSGNGGNGQGGGATKAVKIAGEINSTRDYPSGSRDARLGHEVIVYMTVPAPIPAPMPSPAALPNSAFVSNRQRTARAIR